MAAKGGAVRDITPGDCLELLKHCREVFTGDGQANRHSPFFYQLLHTAGVFPAGAPPTVRIFSTRFPGQLTPGQLVDRYDLACRPVRDLLADYLRERQPGVDYNTLTGLASALALSFWKDLETHHPGISSLRLAPDIAAAWKQRIQTRTIRSPGSPGQVTEGLQEVGRRDPDDSPGVLPRPGPMGPRRAITLGPVGSTVPDPRRRHPAQEGKDPPQGAHGPKDPPAAPAAARSDPDAGRAREAAPAPGSRPPPQPSPASCSPPGTRP